MPIRFIRFGDVPLVWWQRYCFLSGVSFGLLKYAVNRSRMIMSPTFNCTQPKRVVTAYIFPWIYQIQSFRNLHYYIKKYCTATRIKRYDLSIIFLFHCFFVGKTESACLICNMQSEAGELPTKMRSPGGLTPPSSFSRLGGLARTTPRL